MEMATHADPSAMMMPVVVTPVAAVPPVADLLEWAAHLTRLAESGAAERHRRSRRGGKHSDPCRNNRGKKNCSHEGFLSPLHCLCRAPD
jgi:hypothetical protein